MSCFYKEILLSILKKQSIMNVKFRYFLYGFLFGLSFPIMAIALQLYLDKLSLSMGNIVMAHRNNPLIYMIDSAPVFLGWFAYIGGVSKARSEKLIAGFKKLSVDLNASNAILNEDADEIFNELLDSTTEIKQLTDEIISGNEILFEKNVNNLKASEKLESSTSVLQNSTHELIDLNKALKLSNDSTLEEMEVFKNLIELLSENFLQITAVGSEIKTLSINSSIEANKYGVAGKSFSVIARQIKQLSEYINELNGKTQEVAGQVTDQINLLYGFVEKQNNQLQQILSIISEVELETSTNRSDLSTISSEIHQSIDIQDNHKVKFGSVSSEIEKLSQKKLNLIESLKKVIEDNSSLVKQISSL